MAVERDGTRTGLTAVAIGERDRPGARPFYRHDEEGTLKWPQPPNPHTRGVPIQKTYFTCYKTHNLNLSILSSEDLFAVRVLF
ncbi:hypothetical protein DAI22_07g280900 [Oryza sativa Japonica Group]|nr:hypothetical protein DAI22_07g280900 [Oryza sativa Japonica Group]